MIAILVFSTAEFRVIDLITRVISEITAVFDLITRVISETTAVIDLITRVVSETTAVIVCRGWFFSKKVASFQKSCDYCE